MKTSELQLGDWVSCLGDPVRVASLILKDKKHMSPLKNIYMYKKKDIKPISLTADILIDNRFTEDTIGSGLILHIYNSENLYVLVNYRYNGECRNVEISNNMYNISCPIKYVHELQHALRLCGLSELAENLKVL